MDDQYGKYADHVNKIVNAILFTLIGSAGTVFVLQALNVQAPTASEIPKILFSFQSKPISYQLWFQAILLIITNGVVAIFCELLPPSTSTQSQRFLLKATILLDSAVRSIRWGFVNFIAWGSFSALVQALAIPMKDVNLAVFFTAATIGGSFHCPLCHFAFHYIGERALFGSTEEELYLLKPRALLRLILPNFLAGIGAGVFFGYFSAILPFSCVFPIVYNARFQVAAFLIIWLLFLWLFFYTIDQNSFMRRALRQNNVFRVWMTFFILWLGGLLLGTLVYEHIFVPYLLVSQK